MIFDELNTGFRWYDSLDKQTRFKEYCSTMCDFALMSPCNDLLPFQIRTDNFVAPVTWNLVYLDGTMTVPTVLASVYFTITTEAVSWSIDVTGYGTIATATFTTTVDDAIQNLVDDINVGGIFTAIKFGSSIIITAPSGSGEAFNGVEASLGINYGMFAISGSNDFTGASDETTSDTLNINSCIPYLSVTTADSFNYLQYVGGDLPGCMSQQMECGKWYSTISDGTNIVYSEVFEVLPIEDIPFEQMKLPLFSAWRWYDSKEKQTRYKEYCESLCNFYLLTGTDKLLPFQIKTTNAPTGIQSWKLVSVDEDCEILLDTSLVTIVTTTDGYRILYDGGELSDLYCGKFYSVLDDGYTVWYSELIQITDAVDAAESNYLLQETGSKILQETNDGILL